MKVSVPGLRYKVELEIIPNKNRLFLKFGFCKELVAEIKDCMEDPKWHGFEDPPVKLWSIPDTFRNRNVLAYLGGHNIYANFERPLINIDHLKIKYKDSTNLFSKKVEPVYEHQWDLVQNGLTYKQTILASEMGTGKTRAAIITMQECGLPEGSDYLWVGTKGSLRSTAYEFEKWGCKIVPQFLNYEKLRNLVETWVSGKPAPRFVVFDESSRLKTATSQRSKAAKWISDSMRKEYGLDFYILEMSGAPAPKNPVDWWHQAEIAYPGFVREGSPQKFQARLCIQEENESMAGGRYKTVVSWLDDEKKCAKCGLYKDKHEIGDNHTFTPSKNEVFNLYERLKGLVIVKLKKDCLKHLPEKRFEKIICPPTPSLLRTARVLAKTAPNAMTQLTLLRELSDGFLYEDKVNGKTTCPVCNGTKKREAWFNLEGMPVFDVQPSDKFKLTSKNMDCECGDGQINTYERTTKELPCPKDDALIDLLDNHEDVGRFVVYGSFRGTIDRCVNICRAQGWNTIRVDARGWVMYDINGNIIPDVHYLKTFQEDKESFDRVVFIGHPKAAGMGLTLTASPGICFFSNDFDADSRIQAMDRIHRPGMDLNRGATIYDLLHLATDEYILNNLNNKQDMMNLTMGEINEALGRES